MKYSVSWRWQTTVASFELWCQGWSAQYKATLYFKIKFTIRKIRRLWRHSHKTWWCWNPRGQPCQTWKETFQKRKSLSSAYVVHLQIHEHVFSIYFFTLHTYFRKKYYKSPACHWFFRKDVTKRRRVILAMQCVSEEKQIPLHKRRILQIPYTSLTFAAIQLKFQPF